MARPAGSVAGVLTALGVAAAFWLPGLARAETMSFGGVEPAVRWAVPLGEEDRDSDQIDGIAVGPTGATVITGVMRGTITLGDQVLRSRGEGDVFLAAIDADGTLLWARQFGGPGDENAYDLASDGAGNVYVSGWYTGTVDFGGLTLQSAGGLDMFVTKYDPSGALVWARSFGGPGGDGGNEIAVLDGGELAVSLDSEGGPTVADQTFAPGGGERDAFLLRMSSDGEVRWVHPFAGPGAERARAVAINDAGEVFVGFQYSGSFQAGGSVIQSRGGWDGALVKLTAEGSAAWTLPVGGDGTDNVRGLAAAPDGSVYASGVIDGPAILFDREVPAIGRGGDDYLVRLTDAGKPMWVVSLGGRGPSAGIEIEADRHGVVASGALVGDATLRRNRDTLVEMSNPSGRATSYLAAFTADGQPRFVWSPTAVGARSGLRGSVLALSRDGRYLAQALRFSGEADIEGRRFRSPSDLYSDGDSIALLLDLDGA